MHQMCISEILKNVGWRFNSQSRLAAVNCEIERGVAGIRSICEPCFVMIIPNVNRPFFVRRQSYSMQTLHSWLFKALTIVYLLIVHPPRWPATCQSLRALAVSSLGYCLFDKIVAKKREPLMTQYVYALLRSCVILSPSSLFQLRFLSARKHPKLGLETLAIMFSLPYALLMWG